MAMQKTPIPDYLEPEEVRLIINAVAQVSKHPERDMLILELMWQSGARVSEALGIKPEQVGVTSIVLRNLKQEKRVKKDDKTIRVRDDKADKKVEVSGELCRHLKDYCRRNKITKGHYIFQGRSTQNKALSRMMVHRVMSKASEAAGIFKPGKAHPKTGKQYRGAYPHLLRHSNAIVLLDQIGDPTIAQHQLGHSNIRTTLAYIPALQRKVKRKIKDVKW